MPVSVTPEQLIAMEPCDLDKRLALFRGRKSLNARQALAAGASLSDLIWVAGQLSMERECVLFALKCAERVAHLNPDPRVQAALDATRAWLDAPSEKAARAAWSAGWSAWSAGAGDWTADAVARAAGAAGRAVEAAAGAARAAGAAARAAEAAARAAEAVEAAWDARAVARAAEEEVQKAIFLEIFG